MQLDAGVENDQFGEPTGASYSSVMQTGPARLGAPAATTR
jgi:hypothetical protein